MNPEPDAEPSSPPQPPRGKRTRRQRLGEPRTVVLVVGVLIAASIIPLLIGPLTALPGQIALAVALFIGVLVAMSIKRETDRIRRQEEERSAPRCHFCGRRYDEPLEESAREPAARCPECGRPTVESRTGDPADRP
jgi:DNA-directed RNA polymerase subunit RPC12/RpoP